MRCSVLDTKQNNNGKVCKVSWKEDAKFVGAMVRGGDWEIGLRIARSVEINAGNGGDRRSESFSVPKGTLKVGKTSINEFAAVAGIGVNTVRRYLAAWEWAANDGLVDASADLNPDDEYDFSAFDEGSWKEYYEVACMNPPPWNPQAKPLDSAYGGGRQEAVEAKAPVPTPAQISAAIKNDPAVERAAKETIYDMMETDRKHGRDAVAARGGTVTPIADIRKQDQDRNARLTELIRADGELADVVKGWLARIDEVEALTNKIVESGPFGDAHWREQLRAGTKKLSDIAWSVEATIVEGAAQA